MIIKELEAPWAIEKGRTPDILLTRNQNLSYPEIGRLTGHHHTTVLSGLTKGKRST